MDVNFAQEDRTMKTIAVATATLIFTAPALAQTSPATQAPSAAPANASAWKPDPAAAKSQQAEKAKELEKRQ